MKIFKIILILLAVVVGTFLGVVGLQPDEFRISRSATIAAPPPAVFQHVNDFHLWQDWSPWAKIDPACKVKFEGPSSGKDAKFNWNGNDKVGEGSMTILDSKPNDSIQIKLEFARPFQAANDVNFTFKPEGENTVVTWTMSGHQGYVHKAICLLMGMQKAVGGDFEKGLSQMKAIVEAKAKK